MSALSVRLTAAAPWSAAVRTDRTDGRSRRAAADMNSVPARDYAPDRFAGLWVLRERLVFHALFHFETTDRFRRIGGLVNVNWHGVPTRLRAKAPSARPVSRSVFSQVPSTRYETRPACRPVRRYARQRSRAEPEADSKANARNDSCRNIRETRRRPGRPRRV